MGRACVRSFLPQSEIWNNWEYGSNSWPVSLQKKNEQKLSWEELGKTFLFSMETKMWKFWLFLWCRIERHCWNFRWVFSQTTDRGYFCTLFSLYSSGNLNCNQFSKAQSAYLKICYRVFLSISPIISQCIHNCTSNRASCRPTYN